MAARKSYPYVNVANGYARDVVRGNIPACRYVIQASQRHLDDLAKEKSAKFRFRFDKLETALRKILDRPSSG